jgi:hypothetical protein
MDQTDGCAWCWRWRHQESTELPIEWLSEIKAGWGDEKKHRLVDELVGGDLSQGLSAQECLVKKAESKASWGIICRELGPWLLFVSVPMPYRMVKKPYILATSVVYKPFPRSIILCCTKL